MKKRMSREARTATRLVGVVIAMGALSWAAVPFYDWFCRVTGFGGTTQVASAAPDEILDEIVRVRFDANTDPNLGWVFRPMQNRMDLRIGENGLAYYEAINISDVPLTATASYNVAPEITGYYFDKIECFCFTEQTLQPGERMEMPVSFYIHPSLVKDRDAGRVRDITLSYTFHRTEPRRAALDTAAEQTIN